VKTVKKDTKVKTGINAGRLASNHNATKAKVKVKTGINAGRLASNHNLSIA
jgi:hypothetical protein